MNKIFKLMISFFVCIFIFSIDNHEVKALSTIPNVYFIVSNESVNKKDELILNINIDNYEQVHELKLGINIPDELNVKILDNGYYDLSNNSLFTNVLVNNLENDKLLKLHICREKEDVLMYQNNIASVKFTSLTDIKDTITLLKNTITLYLFDKENKLINHNVSFSEKLDATWDVSINEIEVNSDAPDYTKSFIVNNRSINEYELIVEQNIDTTVLGVQAVTIIVVDKVNKDYLIYNKAINVIDKTAPFITYPNTLNINDVEIGKLILDKYLSITDNYDLTPKIEITYLDKNKEKIETFDEYKNYLISNQYSYLSFYGVDSSNNKSEIIEIEVIVKDTTPPVILEKYKDAIYINDDCVDSFKLEDYFEISDNYDSNPKFIYSIKNNQTEEKISDIINALKEGVVLQVEYYGLDISNNESKKKKTLVKINDITKPIISGLEEINLKDYEVSLENIIKTIIYSDNLDKNPSLIMKYLVEEKEVNEHEFIELISKGYIGSITYKVIDSSKNESEQFTQVITVIDTTAPLISIKNIKENGKYLKLEDIEFDTSDNFIGDIDVVIKLDDVVYEHTLINNIGKHKIEIIAKDKSGNESIKSLEFFIIENNINGCMGDIDCYVENYTAVIISVTVMMIGIITVIIIKSINAKKKKKKELIINE